MDERAQLSTAITSARWFSGKGRPAQVRSVTPLPWVVPPGDGGPAVRFEIAEIGYTDDPAALDYYQLAVSYRTAPAPELESALMGELDADGEPGGRIFRYDALQDPGACRALLAALLDARRLTGDSGEVTFHLSSAVGLSAGLEPQTFTGQQSNTSVVYGDAAIIKFFRRLEMGRNLDIEVHDALSSTGVADVAGLFGWVEASWTGADGQRLTADLAMATELLANAHDGWGLALDSIAAGADFADQAHALGAVLVETHAALRAAFRVEQRPGSGVGPIMQQRLTRAADAVPGLQPYGVALGQVFDDLGHTDLQAQRVHGDFHLGQTLRTPSGWKIIDFEGEPVKTLAERAEPDSVWRDIAAMLRSFDYAAASVPGPGSAGWALRCREAFLQGYLGGPLTAEEATLLRAYEADKAIYEVVYEARNRPDWVGIPLAAVAELASARGGSGGPEHPSALAMNQVKE